VKPFTREERRKLAEADAIRKARRKEAKKARPRPARPHQNRERDGVYLAYVRRLPCVARHLGNCNGPVEAAHLRFSDPASGRINPGMQRKSDDRWALPLCRLHHAEQHSMNERRWWEAVAQRDPNQLAIESFAAFQALP
jgi:hypothetical protein